MQKNYQYYVEGPDEKILIDTIKSDSGLIISGKVDVFNFIQNFLKQGHTRPLKNNTIVVLVYDTDVEDEKKITTLRYNIQFLKKQSNIIDVICIPQVTKLEDELVRACNIRKIKELTNSKSNKDFKKDLLKISNLADRLNNCEFQISKFWSKKPSNRFKEFENNAHKIKLQRK